jgi:CHAT domain-containing protein
MGISLEQNPQANRAENLEQAIYCYQQALEVFTRVAFPEQWAMIQNNLANAYSDRIRGERAENLEQAIHHFQQALEFFTRTAFPKQRAGTQNNLAITYSDRIRGERAENLEMAIHYYRQALEVRTRAAFPEQWATTQNNLALAYRDRIRGEHAENLEQAIHHYQQALEVRTRASFPEDWAMTQNNLAITYSDRIRGERAENLEQAIHHYQQALEVFYTHAAFPEQWAATQNNLAAAYRNRIRGERAENLEQAIHHYQQALEVRTRAAFPEKWAETQNNLANAYSDRIRGERAENLEQAIHHFQQALEVRTRASFPADHRQTQRNLGNLLFEERRWPETLTAYQSAIAAGADLLASSYSEAGRQAEVSETARLFTHAAYSLLQTQQYDEALLMLEHGKTRLLAEALALGDLDTKVLSKKQRAPLQAARQTLRMLEAEMRLPPDTPARRSDRDLGELLRAQRANLNALIDTIRHDNPTFMPTGLELAEILQLIPAGGALVAPLITSQGSAVFIILQGVMQVLPEHIIPLTDFKDDDLNTLLLGTEEQPGWLRAYSAYYTTRNLENWQAVIETLLQRLWKMLIAPIHQRLSALNVKRLLLLPSGGLQLLPLHAAWRIVEDGQKRALLDDYEISYAPSAYAYSIARHRAAGRTGKAALIVGINAYKNAPLVNAVPEAAAIANLLEVKPLCDDKATKPVVKNSAAGKAYFHFSCHGSFNWGAPLDSSLILAHDEPLTLSEVISELDLRSARLVTLSACETGISDIRQSPDEYISLPAGFLQAGAPAIVSSLWAVDDRSTALLMERFYRNHLECGLTYSAALREAQLWLRDATVKELGDYYKTHIRMSADDAYTAFMELNIRSKPDDHPYANPFYWAAFTLNGAD